MSTLYKLTNQGNKTQNNTVWGKGVTHSANVDVRAVLCTEGVIHAYTNKHIAVLLNPVHAAIVNPKLWLAEGEVIANDGAKVGCRSLTTIKEIELPVWTLEMKVEFAIRCALSVYSEKSFVEWANKWLSGEDRSKESARAARAAAVYTVDVDTYYTSAYAAADAAYYAADAAAAAYAAAYAAAAAAYYADAAAAAAYYADAAAACTVDVDTYYTAATAAVYANRAAAAAAAATAAIDIAKIAKEVYTRNT